MTPMDRAKRITPITKPGSHYVVSLADDDWRIILSVTPELTRADQLAALARHIIAREIAQALADEDCRIAAHLSAHLLKGGRIHVADFLTWCREQAELHIKGCIAGADEQSANQPEKARDCARCGMLRQPGCRSCVHCGSRD